jgi:hypothetical protein
MPEAYPFGFHHPVDYRTASAARSQAVPQILARRDDQRRLMIVMERAQADQVRSVALKLDPSRLGQPLHRYFSLQPLDLMLRNPRHSGFSQKGVKIFKKTFDLTYN